MLLALLEGEVENSRGSVTLGAGILNIRILHN